MTTADLFGPDWISSWVTGTALVLLAAWLYLLDVGNVARRIFALLLLLRGLTFFLGPLRFEAETPTWSVLWANLAPYAILPVVSIVVAFLSLYPRRRGLGKTRWGLPLLFLATAGLEVWYVLDHSAYATVGFAIPAPYSEFGPLFIFTGLRLPALALAGYVLAGDYRKAPEGSTGFSLFLMVAAFTLNGLYDGTLALLDLIETARTTTDWFPWDWTRWWPPVLALPISLATCVRLLPVLRLSRENPELQEISRFFFAAVPLALLSAFVRLLPYGNAEDMATFILAVWRLAIPFLLAYALLRYQLFDIDIRLKDGVRRAIIVAAFTVTFFLVSEAAESLLEGDRGPVFGIVAAGFLALGARPVQQFAGRISDAFMPDTKPIAEQTYEERTTFYLEQYRLITTDGRVTPKERRMLVRLQRTLSLSDDAAHDLETVGEVHHAEEDRLGAPLPKPSARKATRDSRLEIGIKTALVAGAMALFFGMLSQGIESVIPLSGTVAGLVSAAAVALLLGPLESLADRLTHRIDPTAATEARDEKERVRAFAAALATALEDGSLSPRDLDYLNSLQARLGIPWSTRWRLERRARRLAVPTGP